jgi:hypothetical protein
MSSLDQDLKPSLIRSGNVSSVLKSFQIVCEILAISDLDFCGPVRLFFGLRAKFSAIEDEDRHERKQQKQ